MKRIMILAAILTLIMIGCNTKPVNSVDTIPEWGEVVGVQDIKHAPTISGSTIYKIKDKETGTIVYVLIGGDGRGSITTSK